MKRLIAAAAAICMLFAGCGVINDSKEYGRHIPTSEIDTSDLGEPGRVEKLAIYFLNSATGTLTAEIRNIVIEENTNPAEAAIKQLLNGPSNDKLTGVAPEGMTLDRIECSRDLANIYLSYNGAAMEPQAKFTLETAIADTVTDILGTTYISVFYNGMNAGFVSAAGVTGVPYGPLIKQTGSIEEAWLQASAKYAEVPAVPVKLPEGETGPAPSPTAEGEQITPAAPKESYISTVLYYISSDGGFILPEVRIVEYAGSDYIKTLLSELGKGPQNASIMANPLADGLELAEDPAVTPADGGGYNLLLNFSKLPTRYDYSDPKNTVLSYAAIVYTITTFLPAIKNVDICVSGNKVGITGGNAETMRRNDFLGFVGSSAPLYFEDKNSDLLLEVSRSMEQAKTWNARERLLELLKGPLISEEDANPIMLLGITEKDIISVDVYEDTAYVNLSRGFKDACAQLIPKSEMLLVYSIVNTITSMDGINKVQFLIEGKQTETLAGNLCLSNPFIRNYGIIKQTAK
jgi:spore germination protein GerM